jgi:maltose O-acetyltransferase
VNAYTTAKMKILFRLADRVADFFNRNYGYYRAKALLRTFGSHSSCNATAEIKYGENISVGDHTTIGAFSTLGGMSEVRIGDYVRISRGVVIETAGLDLTQPPPYKHISKPIVIEDGVWIASNAVILGGVTIGRNAIIGAGAVVTKNVDAFSVFAGKAAGEIKKIETK